MGAEMTTRGRNILLSVTTLLVLTAFGCASFDPRPLDDLPFVERAQTKSDGKVTVSVAALSAEESEAAFGVDLAAHGIQPVWVSIDNQDDTPYYFPMTGVDTEYFSPLEAAYKSRFTFGGSANQRMDAHFEDMAFKNPVIPGALVSGFVFTNLDAGSKFVNVDLIWGPRRKHLTFSVPVPGLRTVSQQVDFARLYTAAEIVNYDDEAAFRIALEQLPCCTTNKAGTAFGDPLNFVVIGEADTVAPYFIRRGWHRTEVMYGTSVWKTVQSFLFGTRYRYSPMSPLYVYGRPQDVALQKARATVDERNHLRGWLTPIRFQGQPVWIGQISRDIGVRFTTKTWNLTTHKIDPNVDETRNYLGEDLLYSGGVVKFGWVRGAGAATREQPRQNLTGDPYFTDGFRLVLGLSEEASPFSSAHQRFDWERPLYERAQQLERARREERQSRQ